MIRAGRKQLAALIAGALLCSYGIFCRAQDGWDNLAKIGHKSSATFTLQDGQCVHGTVLHLDGQSVTVGRDSKAAIVLSRGDILEVGEGGPHNVVYSARSSWKNVMGADPRRSEHVLIVLKNGQRLRGKPKGVTVSSIEMPHAGKNLVVQKQDVATIDYIRQKPLTDGEEYIAQEAPILLFFDPTLLPAVVGILPKLTVRIYTAALEEDDRELLCKPTKSETVK